METEATNKYAGSCSTYLHVPLTSTNVMSDSECSEFHSSTQMRERSSGQRSWPNTGDAESLGEMPRWQDGVFAEERAEVPMAWLAVPALPLLVFLLLSPQHLSHPSSSFLS